MSGQEDRRDTSVTAVGVTPARPEEGNAGPTWADGCHADTPMTPVTPPVTSRRPIGRDAGHPGTQDGDRCVPGPAGRAVAGRHAEDCQDPDCPGCQACPHPHCQVCRRRHAQDTCPTCLANTRDTLVEIHQLTQDLPDQAEEGRQTWRAGHGVIPGGDALVMLTPVVRHRPIPREPVTAEPGDPRPPLDVLAYWCQLWRDHTGDHTVLAPTMDRAVDYLQAHLHQLARTQDFPRLARDLGQLRTSLENVLYAGDRAEVTRVPCLTCGTRLQRVWTEDPGTDHYRCPRCRELYDRGRFERAKHDQLHSRGADRFVPLPDALAVTGRPEQTVRTWVRQGHVQARKDPGTGRLEVWWPDVRDRHRATPTRKRRRA